MSRECRKCGEKIPYNIVVDGKRRCLQNRKFCLKCSPFGKMNRSVNEPFKVKTREYKDYSEDQKEIHKGRVKLCLYYRALSIRDELYNLLGGKCIICGYNKCKRALSFHHRDPSKKLFGLTLNNLWSKNRKCLDEEVLKCDLLCLNCHAEVEDKIARETSIVKRVNEKYGTNF